VLRVVRKTPKSVIVDSKALAEEAGSFRSQNMVMLGAASPYLRLKEESLIAHIKALFLSRGEKLVDINLKAFTLGQQFRP
jgi:indolepyruvate ferredoxin oxidoreductase beta subunit